MKYSSAISPAVLGTVERKPGKPIRVHQCPRCKSYDEINLKNIYTWLKPFAGMVHTELCSICILEVRRKGK